MTEYDGLHQKVAKAQVILTHGKFPSASKAWVEQFYDDYRSLFRAYAAKFISSTDESERRALMIEMVSVFSLVHLQIDLDKSLPDDLRELVIDYDHHPDEYPGYKYREDKIINKAYALLK